MEGLLTVVVILIGMFAISQVIRYITDNIRGYNIPKYIKVFFILYSIIAYNRARVVLYKDIKANVSCKNYNLGLWTWFSKPPFLRQGDLILLPAKKRLGEHIVLMVIKSNRLGFETTFVGITKPHHLFTMSKREILNEIFRTV